jgi:hypothetical protein
MTNKLIIIGMLIWLPIYFFSFANIAKKVLNSKKNFKFAISMLILMIIGIIIMILGILI